MYIRNKKWKYKPKHNKEMETQCTTPNTLRQIAATTITLKQTATLTPQNMPEETKKRATRISFNSLGVTYVTRTTNVGILSVRIALSRKRRKKTFATSTTQTHVSRTHRHTQAHYPFYTFK